MRGQCVTFCGLTQMTAVDGGYHPVELDTHLVRISQRLSTTIMASHWLQERINWLWKGITGRRIEMW